MAKRAAQPEGDVVDAVRSASLDVNALVEQVDRVLAEPLYWFPVRHHSPALARHLAACLRGRRPKVVFIEGPSEAQELIEFVVDAQTRPPVAIYSSYREEAVAPEPNAAPVRRSAWFPLVSYSPEYVAMKTAKEIGAEATFIDLPHYAQRGDLPDALPRRDLDQIAPQSDFFHRLATAAGHRTWAETWDALFEGHRPERSHESLRRDVALFCAAVRATTPPEMLHLDGTLARERFMLQTIRRTLEEKKIAPQEALVVCGGFHLFLDRTDATPPPPVPTAGTLSVTLAPYSYFRISELSGYGAGNRAPRFYEHCHERHSEGAGHEDVVIEYVVDVLKQARRRREPLSSADAIGVTQASLMLARLRRRQEPTLDDIHDALITCCVKGDPATAGGGLLEAIDEINIGTKLGRVTDRVGRLPIVRDFYEQLERLDLEAFVAHERLVTLTLDKRQPEDARRSAFLHRLLFLGVEVGTVQRDAAAFGQSIFKEHWRIKWSPKVETALIERSLHGDTIESAAMTTLRERLGSAAGEAGPACRTLLQAVDMDLPQLVTEAERITGHAIDHDDRFASLSDALTSLLVLERYAQLRGLQRDRLEDLLVRCFDRACFAVPEVANLSEDGWDGVIHGLLALAEPVVQRDDLDADLFAQHVRHAASISTMPFLRGAFLGILTEIRRFPADGLAAELLGYARGTPEQQVLAGDFLHGALRVSRTAVLLGAGPLVSAVDELLKLADHDTFLGMIPRLRAAFEALAERQRDALALRVAELYGLKESASLRTLSTSVAASQLMAELDAQVAVIMQQWLSEEI